MPVRFGRLRLLSLAVAVSAGTGCADADRLTAPPPPPPAALAMTVPGSNPGSNLLACPTNVTRSGIAVVGVLGGAVQVGGVRFTVPAGAVNGLTVFVVTVPASSYLEVDIHALGLGSFRFAKPATITIPYDRCGDVRGPFRAWYIDSETKSPIEDMGGVTDTVAHTHTFQTTHLSGYAIAD